MNDLKSENKTLTIPNEKQANETYEEYFNNRTVADIMEEWGEHSDEWKICEPNKDINTQKTTNNLI